MNAESDGRYRRYGFGLGLLVSGGILAAILYDLDWQAFWTALHRIDVRWAGFAPIAIGVSVYLRSRRWKEVSGLDAVPSSEFWQATVVGYVGNAIYPARMGDVARVVALQRESGEQPGRVLAGAFADRLWDMLVFAVIGSIVLFVTGNVASFSTSIVIVLIGTLGVICAVFAIARRRDRAIVVANTLVQFLPATWRRSLVDWSDQALAYFATAHDLRSTTLVFCLTVSAALVDYLGIWLCLASMGLGQPIVASILVGVLISLVALVPAAPGYVGVYQIGTILGLGYFGIGQSEALAASIVIHAATLLVIVVLGVWCSVRYGRKMFSLSRKDQLLREGGRPDAHQ